jgi:uncharacterized protein YaiE (UPF0345 family)
MKWSSLVPAALVAAIALAACSGSNASMSPSTVSSFAAAPAHRMHGEDVLGGIGALAIALCDAAPNIGNITPTAIDLGVDSVGVVANGRVTTLASYSTPYVVNVLTDANDPASIGIGQYFQGQYQQLAITFDTASSKVVAGAVSYPIAFLTNAATQSTVGAGSTTTTTGNASTVTVYVSGNFVVGSNPAAQIQADFNAFESLEQNAQGAIVARPTLFAVPTPLAGQIQGVVQNAAGSPVWNATIAAVSPSGNIANTTSTGPDGTFQMHTIAAGPYFLVVFNSYTTAVGQQINATGNSSGLTAIVGPRVYVTAGGTAQAGTISD